MGFTTFDVGGCNCGGTGTCSSGFMMTMPGGSQCCVCNSSFTITLNSAFCGQTTFLLTFAAPATLCMTDGTNSYILSWTLPFSTMVLELQEWSGTTCTAGSPSATYGTSVSGTCTGGWIYSITSGPMHTAGVTQATVTWNPGGLACCTLAIEAYGCYAYAMSSIAAIAGVTVNVWTDSTMTTLIASGVTPNPAGGGSAYATLLIGYGGTACGTYYLQLTGATRFADYTGSFTLTGTYGAINQVMTPAAGYQCFTDEDDAVAYVACTYPLSETLHCTFPAMAPTSVTFTYAAGLWTSSFSWSGHAYVLTLAPNADMTGTRDGIPFATGTPAFAMGQNVGGGPDNSCPVTGPFLGYIANSTTSTDPGYELDPSSLLAPVTE
jgi:hypothetical protein